MLLYMIEIVPLINHNFVFDRFLRIMSEKVSSSLRRSSTHPIPSWRIWQAWLYSIRRHRQLRLDYLYQPMCACGSIQPWSDYWLLPGIIMSDQISTYILCTDGYRGKRFQPATFKSTSHMLTDAPSSGSAWLFRDEWMMICSLSTQT